MKFLVFLILPFLLSAAEPFWVINSDHSELRFEVDYLKFSSISGQFNEFKGKIEFDEDGELPKNLNLAISSKSIYTANEMRDGHLRGKDFFHSSEFPKLTFSSSKIEALGPGEFLVYGKLVVKGKALEKSIQIQISETIEDTWKFKNRFVRFEVPINRENVGLGWNKGIKGNEILIGNKVLVKGRFQIQPLNKKTGSSKFMIPNTKSIEKSDRVRLGDLEKEKAERSFSFSGAKSSNTNSIEGQESFEVAPPPKKVLDWEISEIALFVVRFFGALGVMFILIRLRETVESKLAVYLVGLSFIGAYSVALWLSW